MATETIRLDGATAVPLGFGPVGRLVERAPALPYGAPLWAIVDECLSAVDNDWLVLLDRAGEAVCLVERAAVLRGEVFERPSVRVAATMPINAVVARAIQRPRPQRLMPLVCDAPDRRYRGLIRVERLLEALAMAHDLPEVRPGPPAPARRSSPSA